jgi:transposase
MTASDTALPAVIGIDIGKEVFHLVGLGADGKIAFRRKIRRLGLKDTFERLAPCIVSMEACLSAHFVSRTLRCARWDTSRGSSRRSTSSRS